MWKKVGIMITIMTVIIAVIGQLVGTSKVSFRRLK
jgi:hypothetical protein